MEDVIITLAFFFDVFAPTDIAFRFLVFVGLVFVDLVFAGLVFVLLDFRVVHVVSF